jgi:hypothetical protein
VQGIWKVWTEMHPCPEANYVRRCVVFKKTQELRNKHLCLPCAPNLIKMGRKYTTVNLFVNRTELEVNLPGFVHIRSFEILKPITEVLKRGTLDTTDNDKDTLSYHTFMFE